jgi:hypothetical protein
VTVARRVHRCGTVDCGLLCDAHRLFMNGQLNVLYVNNYSDNILTNRALHSYFTAISNARIRSLKYIHVAIKYSALTRV